MTFTTDILPLVKRFLQQSGAGSAAVDATTPGLLACFDQAVQSARGLNPAARISDASGDYVDFEAATGSSDICVPDRFKTALAMATAGYFLVGDAQDSEHAVKSDKLIAQGEKLMAMA